MIDLPDLHEEIALSLSGDPPTLPPKLFYDERGARLFEEITRLPEYYPTRTEIEILQAHLTEMARWAGPRARVVEFGSGSGEKTELLLERLDAPAAYIPIDIAKEQLGEVAARLDRRFPKLDVRPLAADYTQPFRLPDSNGKQETGVGAPLLFFPGSTLGNFEPDAAQRFLARAGRSLGEGAKLLLGVDMVKSPRVLLPAYDDSLGVTARFNRNILVHLNRLLGTDFRPEAFSHRAIWNPDESRIEMHLVAESRQVVILPGLDEGPRRAPDRRLAFEAGRHIVTEHSYKYTPQGLEALVRAAGWEPIRSWMDSRDWFQVTLLEWRGVNDDG